MKSEKNILIAFILNLSFSIFEFFGGIFTGSVAIISDAVHDIGDAASIGVAFFLEKKSKKQPDKKYSYGYARYSVMGGVITTLILALGSLTVIYSAVKRIITPTEINYNGMIIFAIVGVFVNFTAALLTHGGRSLNQKAVNIHMLEDVLGWIVVLIGAIIMKFTDFYIIDPLMSIGVALFIFLHSIKTLKSGLYIFLEKTPRDINIDDIQQELLNIEGVIDVHHIHIWSIDEETHYTTMHIVTNCESHSIKCEIRNKLKEHHIVHATLELEDKNEDCHEKHCHVISSSHSHSHSGHHHKH